jgi:hypothetical protein
VLDAPGEVGHDRGKFRSGRTAGAQTIMALTLRGAIFGPVLALALPCVSAQSQDSARSQDQVDLELVLAVDSSGSIDFGEYDLQTGGLAGAFRDAEIIAAIEQWAPKGVAVSVVLWSGRDQQRVAVDWTRISDRASAEVMAARIETMGRGMLAETALGEALRFSINHIERSPFAGERRLIDVSGDGRSNVGELPGRYRDAAAAADITINALAILDDDIGLARYYAEEVIGGRDAFVITAHDHDDFARAMRQKLLQEIRGTPLG